MKVLGHHDVGQLLIDNFGGGLHVLQVVHDVPLGHRSDWVGNHGLAHLLGGIDDIGLAHFCVIHQAQHFFGRLAG